MEDPCAVWEVLRFGALVVAPPAQRGDELVYVLVLGSEVAEQGIEVVGWFDPLLVREGCKVWVSIEGTWRALWIFGAVCGFSVSGFGC